MTAITAPAASGLDPRTARRLVYLAMAAAAAVLYLVLAGQSTLPHDEEYPLFGSLNGVKAWVDEHRNSILVFSLIREGVGGLVGFFENVIAALGWPGVLAATGALGAIFGGWRLAVMTMLGMAAIGLLGLWTSGMDTLAQMLAAVVIALLIGIPLGIIGGRSKRFAAVVTPILDVMQIMPTFAYLAPLTLLFSIGVSTAAIATLIYAIPPAIRITALGIRAVPDASVEAAQSLGSTRWQVLRKVQLPLARRTIGIGVNQTIMMALSMVVITAVIGAPGLGADVLRALQQVNVGLAFQAGLAIVILAIVLDRLTDRAGEWMDPRFRKTDANKARRRLLYLAALGTVVAATLLARGLPDPAEFPEAVKLSLVAPVNDVIKWITTNFGEGTASIKDAFSVVLLNPLEGVLTSAPWWLVIGVVLALAWLISGVRASVVAGVCLVLVVLLGLWEHGMQTLASVLIATALTLILGGILGILSARHDRFRTILRPILDAAQTMPAFVYLIPAVALFSPSRFTAIVAALVYAIPPVIRLVDVGIRTVPATIVEAATAAGSTSRQLLWKVQLPLSRRALLVAANQGIVMVLAMVVVGALVGAGALGYDVIAGFAQGEDFGKGLAAGTAIVLLGIMLDRITQGAGGRPSTEVARGG
ncbi:MAG: ABC transporter permease subunit [Candidatus Limnocylindrales bacterium]|nr:ABC transporter permease subunit [Candidatus Limnocylindrales bacterium]